MTAHDALMIEKAALLDRIDHLRSERVLAQMIDSTARMIAEEKRIDAEIGRARARIAQIEAEIGGGE